MDICINPRIPQNGYLHGYGEGTGFIFIQRSGHGYHTIRTHGYPFTSLHLMLHVLFLSSLFFNLCWRVLPPFFYSFSTFGFEWSLYHIKWFNRTIKPYLRVLFLEQLLTMQYVIGAVVTLLAQTPVVLQNVLKNNNIKKYFVVIQPDNIFCGDFDFIKRYFSELEKQQQHQKMYTQ